VVSLSVFLYDPLCLCWKSYPLTIDALFKGLTHSIYLLVIQVNVFVLKIRKEERRKKEREREREED
jgi:hypothetical protein